MRRQYRFRYSVGALKSNFDVTCFEVVPAFIPYTHSMFLNFSFFADTAISTTFEFSSELEIEE